MEQTNVVSQKQKRQEDLEIQAKQMELRIIALKMGIEVYIHESMLYQGDEEAEELVTHYFDNAEQFYNFLKG